MQFNKWKTQLINFEIILPVVMIIFIIVYMLNISDLPKISRRTPFLVGSITFALLILQLCISLARNLKGTASDESSNETGKLKTNKALFLFFMMLFYNLGIYYLGFFIPTILMLVITMWVIGEKDPIKIIIVSGTFLIVFYLVFVRFFSLKPPSGVLW